MIVSQRFEYISVEAQSQVAMKLDKPRNADELHDGLLQLGFLDTGRIF